jgi:hypothetical protein
MYELKKIGKAFTSKLVEPRALVLQKKLFTGPRSHKGWETLIYESLPEGDTVVSHFLSNCWHLQVASYYRIWHIPRGVRQYPKHF